MPADAKVGNPRAGKPNGKPGTKGAPLGIPKWGWIVGIALGLIIGYMVIRKSGSSSSGLLSSGSDSSPLGNSETGGGGGAVAGSPSPNNPFVVGGNDTQGPGSEPGAVNPSGDSSTSTNPVNPGGIIGSQQGQTYASSVINAPSQAIIQSPATQSYVGSIFQSPAIAHPVLNSPTLPRHFSPE